MGPPSYPVMAPPQGAPPSSAPAAPGSREDKKREKRRSRRESKKNAWLKRPLVLGNRPQYTGPPGNYVEVPITLKNDHHLALSAGSELRKVDGDVGVEWETLTLEELPAGGTSEVTMMVKLPAQPGLYKAMFSFYDLYKEKPTKTGTTFELVFEAK